MTKHELIGLNGIQQIAGWKCLKCGIIFQSGSRDNLAKGFEIGELRDMPCKCDKDNKTA